MATSGSCDQERSERRRKRSMTCRRNGAIEVERRMAPVRKNGQSAIPSPGASCSCCWASLGHPRVKPGLSYLPELPLGCLRTRTDASGVGLRHETAPAWCERAGKSCPVTAMMALSPVTWPTHRRGRPHRRAAGAAHRPWRMISKISGCEYAVSRENGTCGAVPAPPGWRKQAKAVLGARFPVRCAG